MEEPQGQQAGFIGYLHQQAAAAPVVDIRQFDLANDERIQPGLQAADGRDAGSVLVPDREVEPQVRELTDSEPLQSGGKLGTDAPQRCQRM